MKTLKLLQRNLLYILLCVVLFSCSENVKIVEKQAITVDTTYTYKIRYKDGTMKTYRTRSKLAIGDTVSY